MITAAVALDSPSAIARERPNPEAAGEIQALKARDNATNWAYLTRIYLVIAAAITGAIWVDSAAMTSQIAWWWSIPVTLLAIVVVGASQHQFGGAIHEGTHYMLFANRKLNEVASDWLAAFPIFTSTYHFRLHHLAHHQFVNDPERDPDFAQLQESGHWLDFPITHVEMLWALLKQLWLPNLIRYTIARARYSAVGAVHNPYKDPDRLGSPWPLRVGILFAVGVPAVLITLIAVGDWRLAAAALGAAWAATVAYYALVPDARYPKTRLVPVISHRATAIGRITYMALLYGALSAVQFAGWGSAWVYFGLLWMVPLFTTFPFFMILRQWVQHGNADRGRYTNTRVFLVGPLVRYAVFPFGMDYHLPHHLIAAVPHYRLHDLHKLLLRDPEYRDKGVIVEGYFAHSDGRGRRPTALEVLGEECAPKQRAAAYVDNAALECADVSNPDAIAREAAASLLKEERTLALS
jgi:fatty acid desaturase